MEIKKSLITKHGVTFRSETDSEVIVNLISVMYDQCHSIEEAMTNALSELEGTWGIVMMSTLEPNKLYCARHGSPLLIGFGQDFMMVASEQSGFCKYVNHYICLNDKDIVTLTKENGKVNFSKKHDYKVRAITVEIGSNTPDPYEHWTLKEINEQFDSTLRAMGMGGRILNNKEVKLGGFSNHTEELKQIDNLILLGCGTSLHSAWYSMHHFKKLCNFNTIASYDAAEFTKYDIPKIGKTALIFISQSGETKDLHRCVEIGKDNNLFMIGVVNVVDSLIAREVHCGVYLNAGREVGVASTKAFTSQSVVLNLIAIWFAQVRGLNEFKRVKVIECLRRLPLDIKSTISIVEEECKKVANYLLDQNSVFILGKGQNEAIAKEGSLKIKEIGYIHAEGYSSGALKHGPYSIIEKGTPVFVICPDDEHFNKNNSVIEEINSRDAFVVGISDREISNKCDLKIRIPKNEIFNGILNVIPLQLIAYFLAVKKGHNPDKPKGLAKCVSVD